MRVAQTNGNLSARAIAGANVVILAIDIKESAWKQETRNLL